MKKRKNKHENHTWRRLKWKGPIQFHEIAWAVDSSPCHARMHKGSESREVLELAVGTGFSNLFKDLAIYVNNENNVRELD